MTGADVRSVPFPHAACSDLLSGSCANEALLWMQSEAPWQLKVADFYEQWEVPIDIGVLPAGLAFLAERKFVGAMRDRLVGPLTPDRVELIEVTAHRLVAGQTIRIHNDFIKHQETHRVLVQLNGGWKDENGGMLLLFGGASSRDIQRVVRPIHGSGFAFEISPASFHAVSTIHSGERFTLVYSFRAVGSGR